MRLYERPVDQRPTVTRAKTSLLDRPWRVQWITDNGRYAELWYPSHRQAIERAVRAARGRRDVAGFERHVNHATVRRP